MDRDEARAVLAEAMAELRGHSYQELVDAWLGQPDCHARIGPSGAEYQIEIEAFWDTREPGPLRVLGSIDDGTLRHAFSPLSDGFIIAEDSTFVGEGG